MNLVLDLNEVNGVLGALGQMPYAQVYQLVAKIQAQAQEQVKKEEAPTLPTPK